MRPRHNFITDSGGRFALTSRQRENPGPIATIAIPGKKG